MGCAWLVATTAFPGRRWLRWALLAPAALPAYVVAYAYTDILQVAGPVQTWLRDLFGWQMGDYWFPPIRSMTGAIMVMTAVFFPYVYIFSLVAFGTQAQRAVEIARSLGRSPWSSFLTVAIPLARPAIMGGAALVMMETLADFGTVQHFGIPTFTTGIYRTWFAMGAPLAAMKLAAYLLLVIGLVIALEYLLRGRGRQTQAVRLGHDTAFMTPNPPLAWLATLACLIPAMVGFVLPVLCLIYLAMKSDGLNSLALMPGAITDTLWLALAGALVTVIIALMLSLASRRRHGKRHLGPMGVKLATLGYAVPGTVLAVGVLVPFGLLDRWIMAVADDRFGVSLGLIFSGTAFILLYAYATRFLAVAVKGLEPGVLRMAENLGDAAQTLGASSWQRLFRVYLPVLRPSVLTASVFVFVEVVKELPATLVLRPFHVETLALLAYRYAADERLVSAALPSLTIGLIGVIPVIILGRIMFARSQQG
ncbi:MAG: iron ABC transporter permease [Pseudomonadota bacterium]